MSDLSEDELRRRLGVLVQAGKITEEQLEEQVRKVLQRRPPPSVRPQSARTGGKGGRSAQKRPDATDKLKAPYRFVTIDDRIAPPPDGGVADHYARPLADGFCATLHVRWAAETPLLIGEPAGRAEKDDGPETIGPLKLGDRWIVPGASIRGMIRAATEIIAFARLAPVNAHHRYGLRDFLHPHYAPDPGEDTYSDPDTYPLSDVNRVHAGWLTMEETDGRDVYSIQPCKWAQVEVHALLELGLMNVPDSTDRSRWVAMNLLDKYVAAGMAPRVRNPERVDWSTTYRFRPVDEINGKETFEPSRNGDKEGVFVFSGKAPGRNSTKRLEYVFHTLGDELVELTDEEFARFEIINSTPSRNRPAPDGAWKTLKPMLRNGGKVPVFYVGAPKNVGVNRQEGKFAFGLTRLFKVPHRHSVGDVRKRHGDHGRQIDVTTVDGATRGQRKHLVQCDFVENLFGYVYEPEDIMPEADVNSGTARKGRVSFSFGSFDAPGRLKETETVTTVMMGPRASFAPFYLRGEEKDYGSERAKLAGRKRYLPRYPADRLARAKDAVPRALARQLEEAPDTVKRNRSVQTSLRFLAAKDGGDITFTSRIRLHNMRAAEIGAILWALTHGGDAAKPYRHMMGRARAFGAGQIRVAEARLEVEANAGKSKRITWPEASETPGENHEGFCPTDGADTPAQNASHKPFIEAFETYMSEHVGEDWRESAQIQEFLALSRPETGSRLAADGTLEYIADVQDFSKVRDMAKLNKHGAAPVAPGGLDDRYLSAAPRKNQSRD